MKEIKYNINYYHGLDSSLSVEKRTVLKKFGKVNGSTYDYRNPKVMENINESFDETAENTVIIGSSFGGYLANIFSVAYDLPCLLFNPALPYRSIYSRLEQPFEANIASLSYIVLGRKDDIINCEDNLEFIDKYIKGPKEIIIEEQMAHQIPIDIFSKHISGFFEALNNDMNLKG